MEFVVTLCDPEVGSQKVIKLPPHSGTLAACCPKGATWRHSGQQPCLGPQWGGCPGSGSSHPRWPKPTHRVFPAEAQTCAVTGQPSRVGSIVIDGTWRKTLCSRRLKRCVDSLSALPECKLSESRNLCFLCSKPYFRHLGEDMTYSSCSMIVYEMNEVLNIEIEKQEKNKQTNKNQLLASGQS